MLKRMIQIATSRWAKGLARVVYLSRANESAYARDIDEVNILEGYLGYELNTLGAYFSEVNEAIKGKTK